MSPSSPPPRGDPFKLLFRAYFAFVWHRVRCAGVRDADVADVVQEVFAALHRAMDAGEIDTSEPLWGWLLVTTMRKARDWLALGRHQEVPTEQAGFDEAHPAPSPEEHLQTVDVQANLRAVLGALPTEQRLVLLMSVLDEMPMSEIAGALGIPVDTGYSRLKAAKKNAARIWDERCQQGSVAVMPFALWSVDALLETQRAVPPPPPGVEEAVWQGISSALRAGVAAAGAAAAGGAAVKVGTLLTGKQIAVGVIVSAMAGAGVVAAARGVSAPPPEVRATAPVVVSARSEQGTVAQAAPRESATAGDAVARPAVTVTAPAKATGATGTASPVRSSEAEERIALDLARAALERDDLQAARAALAKVKGARFAPEREELRRQLRLREDGGP